VAAALLALVAGAWGGGEGTPPADSGAGPGAAVLSVEEALTSTAEGPLAVEGYIIAPEGSEVRLCSALLESYPPQCGEPSLVVEGLDLATVEGLVHTSEPDLAQVSWTDTYVTVHGELRDGVLDVSTSG
jgi:hypothetical protein